MTLKRPSVYSGAYVACLDCGKEFAYNWQEMRIEEPRAAMTVPSSAGITQRAQGLSRLLRLGS